MNRTSHWVDFINTHEIKIMAEIGVWRGDFACEILQHCPLITEYYLIDPWMKLEDWNKPLNTDDLESAYLETCSKLERFKEKCIYLRGRTSDVRDNIPMIDFAYVDGDHTLRGIAIDLLTIWPKIRDGAWIGGDDFSASIWQHGRDFEPSLVFPFAVHFAEGVNCPITALGGDQFLIQKIKGFTFSGDTQYFPSMEIGPQLNPQSRIGKFLGRWAPKFI